MGTKTTQKPSPRNSFSSKQTRKETSKFYRNSPEPTTTMRELFWKIALKNREFEKRKNEKNLNTKRLLKYRPGGEAQWCAALGEFKQESKKKKGKGKGKKGKGKGKK